MFVSDSDLKLTYGVDLEIGKTLVDRKVPVDNLYWKERHLYIPPMIGYLFIPVYMDLQYRLGIPKNVLLAEEHLGFVEAILHSAAKEEFSLITPEEHIQECLQLSKTVSKNGSFLQQLSFYFAGQKEKLQEWPGNHLKALNRGDAYLFTLSYFDAPIDVLQNMVSTWRAFIDYYLVLDDLEDLDADYAKGEDNSLLESGIDLAGDTMRAILRESYTTLHPINPVLSNRIDYEINKTKIDATIAAFKKKRSL